MAEPPRKMVGSLDGLLTRSILSGGECREIRRRFSPYVAQSTHRTETAQLSDKMRYGRVIVAGRNVARSRGPLWSVAKMLRDRRASSLRLPTVLVVDDDAD